MEEPIGYEEEEYEDESEDLGAQKEYKAPKLDRESQGKYLHWIICSPRHYRIYSHIWKCCKIKSYKITPESKISKYLML